MIKFLKFKKIYLMFSASLVITSVVALSIWWVKPSIDFVGGALYEFKILNSSSEIGSELISSSLQNISDLNISTIQYSQGTNSYILRTNTIDEPKKNEIKEALNKSLNTNIEELRFESVGPVLGRELLIKTLVAILIASILIMTYVTYQFKDKKYGISAIIAMFHDAIILLGAFSFLGHFGGVEVDTLFVTAVLTTLSFSVHDTIVVFDRIRESVSKNLPIDFESIVNKAITDTMPRSLNNSLTIIFMLTCLFLMGGVTLKWFVVALLIGTVAGTYSSPFVATQLLYVFSTSSLKWRKSNS